ncbi:hypothetical protein [Shouchella lehensis]|uniref:N-acetyltransferase domain-containing protein n=1 Tax=Shouchella lehensis G1 TaxID=1246626 RepID=A0A060LSI3_9BACI|nr:hypothetical protein [Shouchella lehensis]AIC94226.1 hypothetical protein BleG1_1648 [Shouchella lehensis G1]
MSVSTLPKADKRDIQLIRMQQQVKEIAKEDKKEVIGIEQIDEEEWVIVSKSYYNDAFQVMINDCSQPYDGKWDFVLEAEYKMANTLFIDDIKGEPCRGYGSICMHYLKEIAWKENCDIQGHIVQRDWDHVDRLTHFYKKHSFSITLNKEEKNGKIQWCGDEPSF